jgi:Spy/CpxP family protein refolding chaperone
MRSIRFRFLVAALAVMLGAAIANSQTADTTPPPPSAHGPRMFGMDHHMIHFYVKALGITDEQQTQMKATLHQERATMKPLMQQMHQLDQQLKPYVQGTYDAAKVQALVSAQAQTLVQLKVEQARIHSELYQMLTPDQQGKLKEIQAEHQARMQQRMQQQNAPTSDSQE